MSAARSKGSLALARRGIVQSELARRLDVSTGIVAYWISGERKPSLPNRQLLFDAFKIPIDAWDQPPDSAIEVSSKAGPAIGESSVMGRIETLESLIDAQMRLVESDKSTTPIERAKITNSLAHTLGSLKRLKGEDIGELRILKHPKWLELREGLFETLNEHPEALDAVVAFLQSFDVPGRKAG